MIRRKCYEELGKRCVVKTESQEVFKKYTVKIIEIILFRQIFHDTCTYIYNVCNCL